MLADRSTDTPDRLPANKTAVPACRYVSVAVGLLVVVEVVSACYLASLNPCQGYDENWYLINAHRFSGGSSLPYAVHRPPLLPLLFALFGTHCRLISALAHVGATGVFFLILRRLVSLRATLGGVALFMACADIRLYNVLALTEMPGMFLTLVTVYLFMTRRAAAVGVTCLLLFMLHWGYVSVVPAFVLVYVVQRRWWELLRFAAGWSVASVPFVAGFAAQFGNPFAPLTGSFAIQSGTVNDVWFYIRSFPQVPVALCVGAVVSVAWLVARRQDWRHNADCALVILLLAIVGSRVSMLHLYESKAARYLVPTVPVLMVLCVLMVHRYAARFPRLTVVAGLWLAVAVLPTKHDFYEAYGLAMDPTHAIIDLREAVAAAHPVGPVYSDYNDLAVAGEFGLPSVAVTGERGWYHPLSARAQCVRERVPTGALYLTWNTEGSRVLASAESPRSGTLYLVRWKQHDQLFAERAEPPLGQSR